MALIKFKIYFTYKENLKGGRNLSIKLNICNLVYFGTTIYYVSK